MPLEEIVSEYPSLVLEDVRAAMVFAADLAREEELAPRRSGFSVGFSENGVLEWARMARR